MRLSFCAILFALCLWPKLGQGQSFCPTWHWASDLGLIYQGHLVEMHTDSIGNTYVLGTYQGTEILGNDTLAGGFTNGTYFLGRMDSLGIWDWVVGFVVVDSLVSTVNNRGVQDFHVNSSGDIVVVGSFTDSLVFGNNTLIASDPLSGHGFAARLNTTSMQWEWVRQVESTDWVQFQSVRVWNNGDAVVGGTAQTYLADTATVNFGTQQITVDTNTSFIAKINATGQWQWVKKGSPGARTPKVAIAAGVQALLASQYTSDFTFNNQSMAAADSGSHIAVMAFNSSGQEQWIATAKNANNPFPVSHTFRHLDIDGTGNAYLSAGIWAHMQFTSSISLPGGPAQTRNMLAKLDPAGNWLWAKHFLDQAPFSGHPQSARTNLSGETFVASTFSSKLYINGDSLIPQANANAYTGKLDSSGNWLWVGMNHPQSSGVASLIRPLISYDNQGASYMGGLNNFPTYFGTHLLGAQKRFVSRIKPDNDLILQLPDDTLLYCGESYEIVPRSSSAAQLNYAWSPPAGLSDSTARSPVAAPDSTTTYTLIANNGIGCFKTARITITKDPAPRYSNIGFLTSTGAYTFCNNKNLEIIAPAYFAKYQWSTGDTTQNIFPPGPGQYILRATDSSGCVYEDSIQINPPAQISFPHLFLCSNLQDSLRLHVNSLSLDSLRWSTGQTTSPIYVKQPGSYWVHIYRNNCYYVDTVEVVTFTDTANADFYYLISGLNVDFHPYSAGIASAHWDFGDSTTSNTLTPAHSYAAAGTYWVCLEATDVCGYTAKTCDSIRLSLTDLKETLVTPALQIYPNPSNGLLQIADRERRSHVLRVTDLSGKLVLIRKLRQAERWTIDLSHLSPGHYIVQLGHHRSHWIKH